MGFGSRVAWAPSRWAIPLWVALAVLLAADGSPQGLERGPGGLGRGDAGGAEAWLGVEVTQTQAGDGIGARDRPAGALVAGIVAGSPADQAGLEQGDVIVAIGGIEVDSPESLIRALSRHAPGTRVRLDWLRSGRPLRSVARLGERPGRGRRVAILAAGIEVRSVQARIAPLPGGAPRRALLVTGRLDRGKGAAATLAPGDLVDEVNRRMVATPEDLEALLDAMSPGATAIVRRVRGTEVSYVPLAVGGKGR